MKIALTLIHNKTPQENEAQIELLKNYITPVGETIFDEESQQNKFIFHYYTVNGLNVPHELYIYQIVPFQPENTSDPYIATLPSNFYSIYAHNVQYGRNDQDKIGTHPRFFNWGLKRGVDYGADISIYMDNLQGINVNRLKNKVQILFDEANTTEFIEETFGKLGSKKLLKEVGQLREDLTFTQAITDLKTRVTQKGYKNG
jgi:hypothetical protein